MRVAVLPRQDAARVITSGIARAAWAVNAANLALTIPLLIEIARGTPAVLPVPLGILTVLLVLAVVAGLNPRPWVVAAFLVLAGAGAVWFQVVLIASIPGILTDAYFVLNRPAVSLVLIGAASTTWITGLLWCSLGFISSTVVSLIVAGVTATPVKTGWGPLMVLSLYVVAYLVLAGIQASTRRRMPDFEPFEEETRRLGVEESLRSKVSAAVHDTLLNDLSLVMNAPDELDDRARARLRADIETLRDSHRHDEPEPVVVDDQDAELRNQLMMIMSDLQWRGLTVHVTGSGSGIYRLRPEVATALVEATRACLENVLRHSGTTVAEIDLAYTDEHVTVLVSDQGRGFDPAGIPADRLGVRLSIVERVEAVGGSVKIWSSPGSGTSVVIRVPFAEMLAPHEEPRHGHE